MMRQLAWLFVPLASMGLPGCHSAAPDETSDEALARAVAPFVRDSNLPDVLVIGDSISIGYTIPVRELLRGKANVYRIADNARDTDYGLRKLPDWLGARRWRVISFNWGLHDLKLQDGRPCVPVERYRANLRAIVRELRSTAARLVWATTTPVPPGDLFPPRNPEDVPRYNAAGLEVMQQEGVPVIDLYPLCVPRLGALQRLANVHFRPEGYAVLAEQVARAIERELARPASAGRRSGPPAAPTD